LKLTTETGIILDSELGLAPSLNDYIKSKKLKNAMVFVVNDMESYLLIINNKPEFENTNSESIASKIDLLTFLQNEDNNV
jgi:hypothetical protein